MATQYTFRRTEKKYLLTAAQYETITGLLSSRMAPDAFGLHTISSVYYDTPDFYLIRRSLAHPAFKEKLRLRGYADSENVFPEIKQKYNGVVYKRRIACTPEEWPLIANGAIIPGQSAQIQRELQAMFLRYPNLAPAVYIAYDRTAYAGSDTDVRITFDQRLRARSHHLDVHKLDDCVPLLPPGQVVMEVKFPGSAPIWLADMLSVCRIYPTSFSKYGRWFTDICRAGGSGLPQHTPIPSPHPLERTVSHP